MLNPLQHRSKTKKQLTEKDSLQLKSDFIRIYGFGCWSKIGLDEFFELLPLMHKEINKQETLRLITLKYYGVKNPK